MASVDITNLTTDPLLLQDLYTTIPAGATITISRPVPALSAMPTLMAAITNMQAAAAITLTAAETGSSLVTATPIAFNIANGSVTAVDVAPVLAATAESADITIRKSFTAAAAGAQDDVTIFAANALPYKMRILDVYVLVSAVGTGAHTLTLRDQAAGAGTSIAVCDSAATGRISPSSAFAATTLVTPGVTVGLFLRRADRDAAGEVVVLARRES